jgi:hypothetical protein
MLTQSSDPEIVEAKAENALSPADLTPYSPEWLMAYDAAILQCKIRYKQMVYQKVGTFGGRGKLLAFLDEFVPGMPLAKINRWLGYIQGVLIEKNVTTEEAEREWTRPLFRPLDFPEV